MVLEPLNYPDANHARARGGTTIKLHS
jgi:hypothetical protein